MTTTDGYCTCSPGRLAADCGMRRHRRRALAQRTTEEKDYDAAAEWAEHDMTGGAATTLRGAAAAAHGRELIERSIDPEAIPQSRTVSDDPQ